jgi:hypothetical protein
MLQTRPDLFRESGQDEAGSANNFPMVYASCVRDFTAAEVYSAQPGAVPQLSVVRIRNNPT